MKLILLCINDLLVLLPFQGSLPLVLMFDLLPEVVSLNSTMLDELMQSLDVYISIREKTKQSIYSVVIKGLERNAGT